MRKHRIGALGLAACAVVLGVAAASPAWAQAQSDNINSAISKLPDAPLVKLPALDKTLKPEESAVVIIDFQNNFAAEKGEHFANFKKLYEDTHMRESTVALVQAARALGIQVIEVTEGYTPQYSELDWGNAGTFHRAQILRQAWKKGTWPVGLYEPLEPGPNDTDILLPNRTTMSGFGSNGLDYILKSRGIRNVAVGGFTTDVCVYATVNAGYDLGYRIFALSDTMAAADPVLSEMLLKASYPKMSRVMTSKQFLGMFPAQQAAAKPN